MGRIGPRVGKLWGDTGVSCVFVCVSRARARAGTELRFEDMGLETQTRMRAGFLALAARHARFRVIDGARAEDVVAGDILSTVLPHLG